MIKWLPLAHKVSVTCARINSVYNIRVSFLEFKKEKSERLGCKFRILGFLMVALYNLYTYGMINVIKILKLKNI